LSTALLTGMTGISLRMQWPLTSQSHVSVLTRIYIYVNKTLLWWN
jgi:hypothetical protein